MILIKNKEVKNLISEMTLEEFEKCLHFLNNEEKEVIERYFDVLQVLGMTEEEVSAMTIEELTDFVKVFAKEEFQKGDIPQEIEIDGVIYKIHEGEFKILAKDLWQIEKIMKRTGKFCISKSLGVILKRKDVELSWNYNDAHIASKAKSFDTQSVTLFLPLIFKISLELGEKIMLLNEARRETT
jgi:hypothetical protein